MVANDSAKIGKNSRIPAIVLLRHGWQDMGGRIPGVSGLLERLGLGQYRNVALWNRNNSYPNHGHGRQNMGGRELRTHCLLEWHVLGQYWNSAGGRILLRFGHRP